MKSGQMILGKDQSALCPELDLEVSKEAGGMHDGYEVRA